MRKEFTGKIRVAARKRADGKCELCKAVLKTGEAEFDHILPDALGGQPTLANCQVLCRPCHRGRGGKTAKDVAAIAEAKRREAIHLGARPAPARPLQGQPFPKTGKTQHREAKARDQLPMPERRPMFARVER